MTRRAAWDEEWRAHPESVRQTLELVTEPGPARDFMQSRPEILSWAEDYYVGFYDCDRDGMSGALTLAGMELSMTVHGITDPWEREQVRNLWRSMESSRREKSDELKEQKAEK